MEIDTDDTPKPNHEKHDAPKQPGSVIAALGVGFILVCILFMIAFNSFQPDQRSLSDLYFPSPTRTFTFTPSPTPTITLTPTITRTPTPNLTATQKAIDLQHASVTADAYLSTASALYNEWDTIISEFFDDNRNLWPEGNDTAEVTRTIANGKYHWTVTTQQQTIQSLPISRTDRSDFYLTIEAKQANGLFSTDYGVKFRENTKGDFYYLGLNNNREYAFFCFCNQEWIPLVDWTQSFIIRTYGNNKLTVIAQGSQFTLFINDQYMTTVTDDRLAKGFISIAVDMTTRSDLNSIILF